MNTSNRIILVAVALLSKMEYTAEERVQVKKEFLRMSIRGELDSARMQLITGFFDTYLQLNDSEEALQVVEMSNEEVEELLKN